MSSTRLQHSDANIDPAIRLQCAFTYIDNNIISSSIGKNGVAPITKLVS